MSATLADTANGKPVTIRYDGYKSGDPVPGLVVNAIFAVSDLSRIDPSFTETLKENIFAAEDATAPGIDFKSIGREAFLILQSDTYDWLIDAFITAAERAGLTVDNQTDAVVAIDRDPRDEPAISDRNAISLDAAEALTMIEARRRAIEVNGPFQAMETGPVPPGYSTGM